MYVHWKSLICFGLIFWVLLCVTDLFGDSSWKRYSKHVLPDILENQLIDEIVKMKLEKQIKQERNRYAYNGILILWNIVAFVFPLIFFIFAKVIYSFAWNLYKYYKNLNIISRLIKSNSSVTKKPSLSKIPILQNKSDTTIKSSATNVQFLITTLKSERSCPNLLTSSKKSEEIDKGYYENLQDQILQVTSENATLSRQLDTVKKEKHELSKQLALAYNENQTAKKQIDELFSENANLSKKLESVTKELKINVKSKKITLGKLEEITCNEGKMKVQLEQVTRDRDILKKKLKGLEEEYEKFRHRLECYENIENMKLAPEKDDNTDHQSSLNDNETDIEVDMKKFQIKINQLQENLNNFNPRKPSFESNSKVSLDLNESNLDISEKKLSNCSYNNTNLISSLINDKICKTNMLASKYLEDSSENYYPTDNTESSSDERSVSRRIISGSVGFQNLLKNLNSNQKPKNHNRQKNVF